MGENVFGDDFDSSPVEATVEDVWDPAAGPDPGVDTVVGEDALVTSSAAELVANGGFMNHQLLGITRLAAGALEGYVLYRVWKVGGKKTWPWYVLSALVGLDILGRFSEAALYLSSGSPQSGLPVVVER